MLQNDNEYNEILKAAFIFIRKAQYNAILNTNYILIKRNCQIGNLIILKSEWGNKFIDNLAKDIKREFPNSTGFSV